MVRPFPFTIHLQSVWRVWWRTCTCHTHTCTLYMYTSVWEYFFTALTLGEVFQEAAIPLSSSYLPRHTLATGTPCPGPLDLPPRIIHNWGGGSCFTLLPSPRSRQQGKWRACRGEVQGADRSLGFWLRGPIIHTLKKITESFPFLSWPISFHAPQEGGREGERESGARRERGVRILYFQRCINHIATVTGLQQVPAQQVPREQSLLPLLPPLSLPKRTQPTCLCTGCPEWVGGWQRLTPTRGKQAWWKGAKFLGSEPGLAEGWYWGVTHGPEFRALLKSFRPLYLYGQWKWFHPNHSSIPGAFPHGS